MIIRQIKRSVRYFVWALSQVQSLVFAIISVINKQDLVFNIIPLLIGDTWTLLRFKQGVSFWIRDMFDILAVYEMFHNHPYSELFHNLKRPTSFIDIGGYNGDSAVYASRFPKVHDIVVVEPLRSNFEALEINLLLNSVKNSQAIQAVVSTTSGRKRVYEYANRRQTGLADLNHVQISKLVKSVNLKDLIRNAKTKSLILKCDAEGAEYEIFSQTQVKVLAQFDRILFEYHCGYFLQEKDLDLLVNRLVGCGFKCAVKPNPILPGLGYVIARKVSPTN